MTFQGATLRASFADANLGLNRGDYSRADTNNLFSRGALCKGAWLTREVNWDFLYDTGILLLVRMDLLLTATVGLRCTLQQRQDKSWRVTSRCISIWQKKSQNRGNKKCLLLFTCCQFLVLSFGLFCVFRPALVDPTHILHHQSRVLPIEYPKCFFIWYQRKTRHFACGRPEIC